jgi:hypothetical protein
MLNFAISTILYISGAACCDCANTNLIVVGHTAVGDDLSVLLHAAGRFDRRRAPLVVFTGNEYDILDDKIAFIRQTGADFIAPNCPWRPRNISMENAPAAESSRCRMR